MEDFFQKHMVKRMLLHYKLLILALEGLNTIFHRMMRARISITSCCVELGDGGDGVQHATEHWLVYHYRGSVPSDGTQLSG